MSNYRYQAKYLFLTRNAHSERVRRRCFHQISRKEVYKHGESANRIYFKKRSFAGLEGRRLLACDAIASGIHA